MPGYHAVLSPSKAHQWLACPPSARLNERLSDIFGEQSSPYAREGTLAHALAELKLRHELGELNDFNFNAQRKALGEITAKVEKATDIYVDTVMEKYFAACKTCPDAQLMVEQRFDMSQWVPKCTGTGDAVIVSDNTLEVLDYKNGSGVPVNAVENPQARLYGLGGIARFGQLYGFTHVRNTIVQPNIDSITEETLTREQLLDWGGSIRDTADLAWRGEGEFQPGEHCRFCNAKAICAARAAQAMSVFRTGFEAPGVIPDEDIPGILKVADVAEQWLKDIRAYALSQALRGAEWTGYKLVRGKKPNRTWKDDETVKEQLIRAGYSEEQYMTTKMKGVSEIEKLLGKAAFDALLGRMTAQGDGNLTLVPEDDKRAAYSSASADFSDLAGDPTDNTL